MLFITVAPQTWIAIPSLSTSALLSLLHLVPVCPSLPVSPNPFIFSVIYIKNIYFLLNFSPLVPKTWCSSYNLIFFFCSLINYFSFKKTFLSLLTWNLICCFWLFFSILNLLILSFPDQPCAFGLNTVLNTDWGVSRPDPCREHTLWVGWYQCWFILIYASSEFGSSFFLSFKFGIFFLKKKNNKLSYALPFIA